MTNESPERPDPDVLLRRVQADEARAHRGRLKIFLGACAGVGKTCAMLSAARELHRGGTPLMLGVVETHGRAETEALAVGLPRLNMREWPHRGRSLQEFDLDAALRFGADHPGSLVLIDELAHSNVAGSRHPKRWQDVEELRGAGVDVWTTMNVQHLESLNDIVRGITGVPVWETVPDRVFDGADEVLVVDLPPDELLARLREGKVYVPQQAERAAAHFFRKGNLLALRELALRRTADRVDGQMQDYRRQSSVQMVWPNREALLACVGNDGRSEKVVRSCARMAAQLGVPWHAVHVETPAQEQRSDVMRRVPEQVLQLAESLGAQTATLSAPEVASALVRYARDHNLVRVVIGRSLRSRWFKRSLSGQIGVLADDLDVVQLAMPAPSGARGGTTSRGAAAGRPVKGPAWKGYAWAIAACGATAWLATPLVSILELTNIVMLFLLAVVAVGMRFGRGPAVLAAFVGVGLFDFFFVQPRFSFAVSDVQYLVTFSVMLVVALVVGQLTAGLKVQAEAARQREHRVRRLYDMARDLSAALLPQQVREIGTRFVAAELRADCCLLLTDDEGRLQRAMQDESHAMDAHLDMAVAQWALDREQPAGRGTDTLPASDCLMLPLKAPMRTRGVLAVKLPEGRLLHLEQRRLLETCTSLLAISLERIHYIEVAQATTLQMESERLRNSLLSAISHDLRTPLASLLGLSETLALSLKRGGEDSAQLELVEAIRLSALRMSTLVNNLLDMARLEAGAVQLRRAWLPLEEVVGSALRAAPPSVRAHGVMVHLAADLPLLDLDAVLFERVFVNLLENAAKYAQGPGAWVLRAWRDDTEVVISLEDEGPGLPLGREAAIFEKFERGDKESATPGVGLGLAICRAIVEAHGGSIRGETRREGDRVVGARFVICLPVGVPPEDDGTLAWQSLADVPVR